MSLKLMKRLCSLDKSRLQILLLKYLKEKGYKKIIYSNMYIIAEGELPICLCAHLDTVFSTPPRTFYYDNKQSILWSPQGLGADDRAGVYCILNLIENGYRPSVIFTDMEERGGIGANELIQKYPECPFQECKAIIELDRQGAKDAVFYNCDNPAFTDLILNYGFNLEWGTFTDISILAPQWGVAAVNLSVGYYNEHQKIETFNIFECHKTIAKVQKMLKDCGEWLSYSYIPAKEDKNSFYSSLFNNCCLMCGKHVPNNEGYVISDYICGEEQHMLFCDKCYDEYKDYFLDTDDRQDN